MEVNKKDKAKAAQGEAEMQRVVSFFLWGILVEDTEELWGFLEIQLENYWIIMEMWSTYPVEIQIVCFQAFSSPLHFYSLIHFAPEGTTSRYLFFLI